MNERTNDFLRDFKFIRSLETLDSAGDCQIVYNQGDAKDQEPLSSHPHSYPGTDRALHRDWDAADLVRRGFFDPVFGKGTQGHAVWDTGGNR